MTSRDPVAPLRDALAARQWTVAVAESLTGGLLADAFVDQPGASRVFRGALVAYATEVKSGVLGVDPALLARAGPVDPQVVVQMAQRVRLLFGADVGLATTGVAGPGAQCGLAPGLAYVAAVTVEGGAVRELHLRGSRSRVRRGCVSAVIDLATRVIADPEFDGWEQIRSTDS